MPTVKSITKLTKADKLRYLSYLKSSSLQVYGLSWPELEQCIKEDVDEIFDDASFSKLPSDKVIFAAYAREFFKWTEKRKKTQSCGISYLA